MQQGALESVGLVELDDTGFLAGLVTGPRRGDAQSQVPQTVLDNDPHILFEFVALMLDSEVNQLVEDGHTIERGGIVQLQTNIGRQVFVSFLGVRNEQLEGFFIERIKGLLRRDALLGQLREQCRVGPEELQAHLIRVQCGTHPLQGFRGGQLVDLGSVQLVQVLDLRGTQNALDLVDGGRQEGIEGGQAQAGGRYKSDQQTLAPQLAEEFEQVDFVGGLGGGGGLRRQINCGHWQVPFHCLKQAACRT